MENFKNFSSVIDFTEGGRYIIRNKLYTMTFNKQAPYEEEIVFIEDMVKYLEHQNWIKIPVNGVEEEYFYSQYYTRLSNGTFRAVSAYDLPQAIKNHLIKELVTKPIESKEIESSGN